MIFILTGCFILLDFATGLIKAFKKKEYNSSIMREGLFHKTGSIIVIVFGALVDYAQGFLDLGVNVPVAMSLCVYIVLMEVGSIIENLCMINPRIIPNKLQSYFHKLNNEEVKKEVDKDENSQGKKR